METEQNTQAKGSNMKTGTMKNSGCTVKIEHTGKGELTGEMLCVVRYLKGFAGSHSPKMIWGPKTTVYAKDVIVE